MPVFKMGEFLMWTAIGTIVGAFIGFLGNVFVTRKHKKDMYKDVADEVNAKIGIPQNKTLSGQHDEIREDIGRGDQASLTAQNNAICGMIDRVSETVTAIDRRAGEEKSAREAREQLLEPAQLRMKDALDEILAMSHNWENLIAENAVLKRENTALRTQIQDLSKGHATSRDAREKDDGLEL